MSSNLEGRTAVVFGVANKRSIAWSIAQGLHAAGAKLVITYQNERLEQEARDLILSLPGAEGHMCDVSNDADIERLFAKLKEKHGKLHVLVHNAGIGSHGGLEDHSREQFDGVMAVNAAAPLFLTQALLEPLRAAGRKARIVIVSSDSGRFTVPKDGVAFPYRMSKAAVNMLTLNLAAALAPDGILVNAMHPGWVRTDMGGRAAPRSVKEGADTIVWLATLPDDGPTGGFFYERRKIDW